MQRTRTHKMMRSVSRHHVRRAQVVSAPARHASTKVYFVCFATDGRMEHVWASSDCTHTRHAIRPFSLRQRAQAAAAQDASARTHAGVVVPNLRHKKRGTASQRSASRAPAAAQAGARPRIAPASNGKPGGGRLKKGALVPVFRRRRSGHARRTCPACWAQSAAGTRGCARVCVSAAQARAERPREAQCRRRRTDAALPWSSILKLSLHVSARAPSRPRTA
jgi:hypothetical protein